MISAMTLGCRKGLRRKERERLTRRTMVVWTMSRGKAKWRGLSPCHTPFDEVLMAVILTAIAQSITAGGVLYL